MSVIETDFFKKQNTSSHYYSIGLQANNKVKSGDQVKDWISPERKRISDALENWDWSKPFTIDKMQISYVSEFDELLKGNNVPDSLPEIGQLELYSSSKLTDFINGSFLAQYGHVVNDNVQGLLKGYNIGVHNYYPLEVILNKRVYNDYHFLRIASSVEGYIDYKKSRFYSQDGLTNFSSRCYVDINSFGDTVDFQKNTKSPEMLLRASEITLTKDFPNYDFFNVNHWGVHGYYISDKLKNTFVGVTGLEINASRHIKRCDEV